jgi:hypothetical protein
MIGGIRRQLIRIACRRHRADLVALLDHPIGERAQHAKAVAHAIDALRTAPEPAPKITDDVSLWLSARSANALYAQDIKTLGTTDGAGTPAAALVDGAFLVWVLKGARQIEVFFAAHPQLDRTCAGTDGQ